MGLTQMRVEWRQNWCENREPFGNPNTLPGRMEEREVAVPENLGLGKLNKDRRSSSGAQGRMHDGKRFLVMLYAVNSRELERGKKRGGRE